MLTSGMLWGVLAHDYAKGCFYLMVAIFCKIYQNSK